MSGFMVTKCIGVLVPSILFKCQIAAMSSERPQVRVIQSLTPTFVLSVGGESIHISAVSGCHLSVVGSRLQLVPKVFVQLTNVESNQSSPKCVAPERKSEQQSWQPKVKTSAQSSNFEAPPTQVSLMSRARTKLIRASV